MPSEFQEYFAEGSFKVKFSTIWTDAAAEVGRVREKKKEEEEKRKKKEERRKKKQEEKKKKKKEEENRGKSKEDQRRERVRRKTIQAHEKIEKSRNTVVLQCFAALEGQK